MEKGMPHVTVELDCPLLQKKEQVGLDVNVFRSPENGGLRVTECSEFPKDKRHVTCGQECVQTQEARELHEKEVTMHKEELRKIGPDVIV
jgi:hypothetical protein